MTCNQMEGSKISDLHKLLHEKALEIGSSPQVKSCYKSQTLSMKIGFKVCFIKNMRNDSLFLLLKLLLGSVILWLRDFSVDTSDETCDE